MLEKIFRKISNFLTGHNKTGSGKGSEEANNSQLPFFTRLAKNKNHLEQLFENCSDAVFREFVIATDPPVRGFCLFIDGLVNKDLVNNYVLKPLMVESAIFPVKETVGKEPFNLIEESLLANLEVIKTALVDQGVTAVLDGDTLLVIDGYSEAFILGAKGWEARSIAEPETETVVRGPRDGFTETLRTNTVLLRRRLKTPRFKIEAIKVGELSKTGIAIAYVDGIVDPKIVGEVRKRVKRIQIDGVLESGYIQEFIVDEPFSPFPTILSTERPDKVAGNLLEGRVAILVDNTPFALIVPASYFMMLQSPEDYYNGYIYASFVRALRFLAFHLALIAPSAYVAITTFHQEMIPTTLLLSLAQAREGVPYPAVVEALLMETTFEILREAGVRLPRPVGQAVSIVGALVIGEAAVRAGLVSPAMVIIVAVTAISNFVIPEYQTGLAIRFFRFPLIILSAMLGLFGLMAGLMAMLIHLSTLRSFGVPYLAPLVPSSFRDWKDFILRFPWWSLRKRPRFARTLDPVRQVKGLKPRKPNPGRGTA